MIAIKVLQPSAVSHISLKFIPFSIKVLKMYLSIILKCVVAALVAVVSVLNF